MKNQAAARITDSPVDAEIVSLAGGDHEFGRATRWLFIGQAGSVRVRMASGAVVDLNYAFDGTQLPIAVTAVYQAGTTAGYIRGMF